MLGVRHFVCEKPVSYVIGSIGDFLKKKKLCHLKNFSEVIFTSLAMNTTFIDVKRHVSNITAYNIAVKYTLVIVFMNSYCTNYLEYGIWKSIY